MIRVLRTADIFALGFGAMSYGPLNAVMSKIKDWTLTVPQSNS